MISICGALNQLRKTLSFDLSYFGIENASAMYHEIYVLLQIHQKLAKFMQKLVLSGFRHNVVSFLCLWARVFVLVCLFVYLFIYVYWRLCVLFNTSVFVYSHVVCVFVCNHSEVFWTCFGLKYIWIFSYTFWVSMHMGCVQFCVHYFNTQYILKCSQFQAK